MTEFRSHREVRVKVFGGSGASYRSRKVKGVSSRREGGGEFARP